MKRKPKMKATMVRFPNGWSWRGEIGPASVYERDNGQVGSPHPAWESEAAACRHCERWAKALGLEVAWEK